jgi:hypothetical protein
MLPSPGVCRGHLNLLDTEEGRPQVTWEPGQNAYFQLSDHTYSINAPGDTHYGGGCQIGFSTDRGQTWKVAASYHGNCPHRHEDGVQTFHFVVPEGMPEGLAIFTWIWLNRDHESFMNCASVRIGEVSDGNTIPPISNAQSMNRKEKDDKIGGHRIGYKKSTVIRSIIAPTEINWGHFRRQHGEMHRRY